VFGDAIGRMVGDKCLLMLPKIALEAVFLHCKTKSIFLSLDELIQSPKPESVCHSLGVNIQDHFCDPTKNLVFTFVSALDKIALDDIIKKSGRGMLFCPLPSLSVDDSKKLFNPATHTCFEEFAYQCAIRDCGGHPRTLSRLYDVALLNSFAPGMKFPVICQSLLSHFKFHSQKVKLVEDLDTNTIAPALLGKELDFNAKIGRSTVNDLISCGMYDNGIVGESERVVPRVAVIRVILWLLDELLRLFPQESGCALQLEHALTEWQKVVKDVQSSGSFPVLGTRFSQQNGVKDLLLMLNPSSWLKSDEALEEFFVHHQSLIMNLWIGDRKNVPLAAYFRGCLSNIILNQKIDIPENAVVQYIGQYFQTFLTTDMGKAFLEKPEGKIIYSYKAGNPG
jgi:hypothetical protein